MSTQIAGRYAQALFQAMPPEGQRSAQEEFQKALVVLQDPEIKRFFFHPQTPSAQKMQLLRSLSLTPILENFLLLTIEKSRDRLLPQIEKEFSQLVLAAHNTTTAEVTSAVRLNPATLKQIREKLEALSGKTVLLESKVEPKIGGGLVIKMDGQVLDGSVQASLRRFQRELGQTRAN